MESLNLTVEGMGWGACVAKLSRALRAVPGVAVEQVAVGSARVSFDPATTSPQGVTDAVARVGFVAREGGEGDGTRAHCAR